MLVRGASTINMVVLYDSTWFPLDCPSRRHAVCLGASNAGPYPRNEIPIAIPQGRWFHPAIQSTAFPNAVCRRRGIRLAIFDGSFTQPGTLHCWSDPCALDHSQAMLATLRGALGHLAFGEGRRRDIAEVRQQSIFSPTLSLEARGWGNVAPRLRNS